MCVTVKTFDELFAELTEKAATRPTGSGTVAALALLWTVGPVPPI